MNRAEYCTIKAFIDTHKESDGMIDASSVISYMQNAICNKTVSIKQLEEMYDSYEKSLWREHEDVRGDDMVEIGYAEQFLEELLMEFGCWDKENKDD